MLYTSLYLLGGAMLHDLFLVVKLSEKIKFPFVDYEISTPFFTNIDEYVGTCMAQTLRLDIPSTIWRYDSTIKIVLSTL